MCVVMCEWMDGRLCHDPAISIVVSFITNNNYSGSRKSIFSYYIFEVFPCYAWVVQHFLVWQTDQFCTAPFEGRFNNKS